MTILDRVKIAALVKITQWMSGGYVEVKKLLLNYSV